MDMNSKSRAAVEKEKLWDPGQTISISFMGGSEKIQNRVKSAALKWLEFINLKFEFRENSGKVRIAFGKSGSWSYIGKDCLAIPGTAPTMNFGWFEDSTPEEEVNRVVLHEFGHLLGMIHEHQNPSSNIQWNQVEIYRHYLSPEVGWTLKDVEENLFQKYAENHTNHSEFDPNSIMLYAIPGIFTSDDFRVEWNTKLSDMDKEFMGNIYG